MLDGDTRYVLRILGLLSVAALPNGCDKLKARKHVRDNRKHSYISSGKSFLGEDILERGLGKGRGR